MASSVYCLRTAPGVRTDTIAPAGFRILRVLDLACEVLKRDIVITCGNEGHAPTDPHSSGEAYDISVTGWSAPSIQAFLQLFHDALGVAFYAQYEVPVPPISPDYAAIAVVNAKATGPHVHCQRARGTNWPPEQKRNA